MTTQEIEATLISLSGVHIIKGDPTETDYSTDPPSKIDNWSKAQDVQHEPFIYIITNGSPWHENNLDDLFRCLDAYSLDPDRTHFSIDPCEGVRDPNQEGWMTVWIDGSRFYEVDGVYSFNGAFIEYSHAFSIHTNYEPLISLLKEKMEGSLNRSVRRVIEEENRVEIWKGTQTENKREQLNKKQTKHQSLDMSDI